MRYIVFDSDELDVDLSFTLQQVHEVETLWKKGFSLINIAKSTKRKPLEVALLIMDRAELKKITPRTMGLDGE